MGLGDPEELERRPGLINVLRLDFRIKRYHWYQLKSYADGRDAIQYDEGVAMGDVLMLANESYDAAMQSKACRLSPSGRYYWRLAKDNRI